MNRHSKIGTRMPVGDAWRRGITAGTGPAPALLHRAGMMRE
jgi:hypothetical protein